MAGLVPEKITRLQATCFVQDAELARLGRGTIIRQAARQLVEQAVQDLLEKCVKTEGDYMGFQGQTLILDAYVMSPAEFHSALAEARMQGERDALNWITPQVRMG